MSDGRGLPDREALAYILALDGDEPETLIRLGPDGGATISPRLGATAVGLLAIAARADAGLLTEDEFGVQVERAIGRLPHGIRRRLTAIPLFDGGARRGEGRSDEHHPAS